MSKVKLILCILLLLGIGALGYYLGYDAHKTHSQMSPSDFQATFTPVSPDGESKVYVNGPYIAISAEEGQFVVYRINDEKILSEGRCSIDGNTAVLENSDGLVSAVVFTDDKWYWIDGKNGKSEVSKISPGPALPKDYVFKQLK